MYEITETYRKQLSEFLTLVGELLESMNQCSVSFKISLRQMVFIKTRIYIIEIKTQNQLNIKIK